MELKDKVAIVTGGSRGIGFATVRAFLREGAAVVLCASRQETADKAVAQLKEEFPQAKVEGIWPNLSSFGEVKAAFDKVAEQYGRVDILVNNAGISYIGLLTEMTYQQWREVIDTNLNACFLTCRYAVPQMVRRHSGKIINISSVWGNVGASMEVAYSASKGGINAFTRALAKELAPSNIQVNAIACGVIDTDMNKCFDKEEMNMLVQEIPADRLGRPEEVAALVAQLCTGNEYLTGQIITLDGGWT